MPSCVTPCHTKLHQASPCHTVMPCHATPCHIVPHPSTPHATQHHATSHHVTPQHATPHHTALCRELWEGLQWLLRNSINISSSLHKYNNRSSEKLNNLSKVTLGGGSEFQNHIYVTPKPGLSALVYNCLHSRNK